MAEITKYVSRNGDNPTYSTDLERLSDATINAFAGLGFLNEGKIVGGDWDGTLEKMANAGFLYFKGKLWGFDDTLKYKVNYYLYAVAEWDDDSTKVVTVGSTKTEYKQRIKYTQAIEATQIADVDNGDGTGKWLVSQIGGSIRNLDIRYNVINPTVAFRGTLPAIALEDDSINQRQIRDKGLTPNCMSQLTSNFADVLDLSFVVGTRDINITKDSPTTIFLSMSASGGSVGIPDIINIVQGDTGAALMESGVDVGQAIVYTIIARQPAVDGSTVSLYFNIDDNSVKIGELSNEVYALQMKVYLIKAGADNSYTIRTVATKIQ
mgnify:CR=1 FL=1